MSSWPQDVVSLIDLVKCSLNHGWALWRASPELTAVLRFVLSLALLVLKSRRVSSLKISRVVTTRLVSIAGLLSFLTSGRLHTVIKVLKLLFKFSLILSPSIPIHDRSEFTMLWHETRRSVYWSVYASLLGHRTLPLRLWIQVSRGLAVDACIVDGWVRVLWLV